MTDSDTTYTCILCDKEIQVHRVNWVWEENDGKMVWEKLHYLEMLNLVQPDSSAKRHWKISPSI